MLLSEPGRTDYDLNFNLFGFHVRTHPAFFILPILLGRGLISNGVNTGVGWLILCAVFFVSVLVHELGHAVAFRYYGIQARIVLYWMGGLAIPDGGGKVWGRQRTQSLNPNQQIVVSFAGPVFGLLLAGLLCLIVYLVQGKIGIAWLLGVIPLPLPFPDFGGVASVYMLFNAGIILNIVLNLFNLVPIYPLDGGQIAYQALTQMDPADGVRKALILSIVVCALMILVSIKMNALFMAFFFGYMAWSNYQMLQGYGGRGW
jgi:stage IV sporulation protein FB